MQATSTKQIVLIANMIKRIYETHNKTLPNEWHKIAATRIYYVYIRNRKVQLIKLQESNLRRKQNGKSITV